MMYKVLVAEDNAALLNSIRIRLTSEGYEVFCARDGYQAVAMAAKHQPDLMILDIHMPAGDGCSVQDRIWKMGNVRHIPVVYVTGDSSQAVNDTAQCRGAYSVMRKPFDTSELLQVVREAIEQVEAPGEVFRDIRTFE